MQPDDNPELMHKPPAEQIILTLEPVREFVAEKKKPVDCPQASKGRLGRYKLSMTFSVARRGLLQKTQRGLHYLLRLLIITDRYVFEYPKGTPGRRNQQTWEKNLKAK